MPITIRHDIKEKHYLGDKDSIHVFDDLNEYIAVLNKDNEVLYLNKALSFIAEDFFKTGKETLDDLRKLPQYSPENIKSAFYPGHFFDQDVTIAVGKGRKEQNKTFYHLFFSSSFGQSRSYVQIDLDTGKYLYVDFKEKDKSRQMKTGRYSTTNEKDFSDILIPADSNIYMNTFTMESLKKNFKPGATRSLVLHSRPINNIQYYYMVNLTYALDTGTHLALISTTDITSEHLQNYDSLTELLNHQSGFAKMEEFIKKNKDDRITFVICDFDDFKSINDNNGHPVGDEVLKEIRTKLTKLPECCRFFTRLGGDEFCFLIDSHSKLKSLNEMLKNLNSMISEIGTSLGIAEVTSISYGSATYPKDGKDLNELYKTADQRLYKMKQEKHTLRGKD